MFHVNRTHLSELYQMRRSGIYIGSTVDQQRYTICCWNQWCKRCSFYAFDLTNQNLTSNQNGSRTSTRYKRCCFPFTHQTQCNYQRGIFFLLDCMYRRFPCLNDFRSMYNLNTILWIGILSQFCLNLIFLTNEIYKKFFFGIDRIYCTFYRFLRCIIPTHRIYCNFNIFAHVLSFLHLNTIRTFFSAKPFVIKPHEMLSN